MSGGSFDYKCFEISRFAEELAGKIKANKDKDAGYLAYDLSESTILVLKECQTLIEVAGKLAFAIEWLYSDDYGEETFAEAVKEILS